MDAALLKINSNTCTSSFNRLIEFLEISESNSNFSIKHALKQTYGVRVSLYSWVLVLGFFYYIGHENNEVQTTEILTKYKVLFCQYLGNSRGFTLSP